SRDRCRRRRSRGIVLPGGGTGGGRRASIRGRVVGIVLAEHCALRVEMSQQLLECFLAGIVEAETGLENVLPCQDFLQNRSQRGLAYGELTPAGTLSLLNDQLLQLLLCE